MSRPKGARDADYEAKRVALLRRIGARVMRRQTAHPSFRQLAEAGEVSTPTLRHYFGDRAKLMASILDNLLQEDRRGLDAVATPTGDLETSIRDYGAALLAAMRAPRKCDLAMCSLSVSPRGCWTARSGRRRCAISSIRRSTSCGAGWMSTSAAAR
ncbi:MAG: hypothetical protein ACK53I_18940 [Phenylobacterium sp.]